MLVSGDSGRQMLLFLLLFGVLFFLFYFGLGSKQLGPVAEPWRTLIALSAGPLLYLFRRPLLRGLESLVVALDWIDGIQWLAGLVRRPFH